MKINGLKALDYQAQGDRLVLKLRDVELRDITGMDTGLVTVETDAGDTVEAFSGLSLVRCTYEPAGGVWTVDLGRSVPDTTAAALKSVTDALAAAQATIAEQQAQLTEQADALCELAELITAGEEVAVDG